MFLAVLLALRSYHVYGRGGGALPYGAVLVQFRVGEVLELGDLVVEVVLEVEHRNELALVLRKGPVIPEHAMYAVNPKRYDEQVHDRFDYSEVELSLLEGHFIDGTARRYSDVQDRPH